MLTLAEKFEAARKCCREAIDRSTEKGREFYNRMFDSEWEAFVVKRDESTGEFIGKLARCADSPV